MICRGSRGGQTIRYSGSASLTHQQAVKPERANHGTSGCNAESARTSIATRRAIWSRGCSVCWKQELLVSAKQQSARSLPSRVKESRELLLQQPKKCSQCTTSWFPRAILLRLHHACGKEGIKSGGKPQRLRERIKEENGGL